MYDHLFKNMQRTNDKSQELSTWTVDDAIAHIDSFAAEVAEVVEA